MVVGRGNQTHRPEISGGYRGRRKGVRNPFYESVREAGLGDLIFSFMDTRIQVIGIVGNTLAGWSRSNSPSLAEGCLHDPADGQTVPYHR